MKTSFKTACRKVGIEDFSPHDLGHTCAAWLVQRDVPIRTVSELLRHSDIRTTMRYAHLAPDNVKDAASELDKVWSHFGHSDESTNKEVTLSG